MDAIGPPLQHWLGSSWSARSLRFGSLGLTMTPTWALRDLIRSPRLVVVVGVFLVSLVSSQLVACNVHELGHAAVGTSLGWEVETIRWCAPGGGSVTYSFVGTWAGNLQGYAGV